MIGDLNECRLAMGYLNRNGLKITFSRTELEENYPKGCYTFIGIFFRNVRNVYWNTHASGAARNNARPICKYGAETLLITISLINVLNQAH